MTTRCGVLGSPITHSLSPVLHRAAYAELGLDWEYDAYEVGSEQLPAFLDRLDASWRGLSLTMPLKRAAVPLLDELTAPASLARAVNTVVLQDGRRRGDNTDIAGLVAALRERSDAEPRKAVVVGGGATAASAVLGLADMGCTSVRLVVRNPHRVGETLEAAGRHPARPRVEVLTIREAATSAVASTPDVVVSTVPVEAQQEAVLRVARQTGVIFEVVYDPWPTPLARLAATEKKVLVSGLDLLVHQAALQVEQMTGCERAPLASMRAAGEAALRGR